MSAGAGKLMMFVGAAVFVVGAVAYGVAIKWPQAPFGRLPGDIAIERERFRFYAPLATSLLLSVAVSAILWLIAYLRGPTP